jgi:hypothetical protein
MPSRSRRVISTCGDPGTRLTTALIEAQSKLVCFALKLAQLASWDMANFQEARERSTLRNPSRARFFDVGGICHDSRITQSDFVLMLALKYR